MYLAEMCCDSWDDVLIDGCSWSRSCRLAVGMMGVVGTLSLPLTCVIPRADSCTIICACPPTTPLQVILPVMAGDCGDEIPSKSKPQSAGVTSCANFENVLRVRYLQTSSFRFYCIFREFHECSRNSSVKSRISFTLSTYYSFSPILMIFAATSFSS